MLLSAGWGLIMLTVIILWILAMLDIKSHVSKKIFSVAQLASIAAAISVMAIVTLATANAAFPASWAEIASSEPYNGSLARPECKGIRGTFVFSFGFEQPSYASPLYASSECPASPTRSSAI